MSRGRFAVIVPTLLAAISPLLAQTGSVRVRVTDPLGARISDAVASFLDKDKKVIRQARSDRMGELILTNLPVGDGNVEIDIPGFRHMTWIGLKVGAQGETLLSVQLQPARINVDYVGPGPVPVKRVRVHVTDSTGLPTKNAHGWAISDGENSLVTADEHAELVFDSIPPYPGLVVAADGFSSKVVELASDGGDEVRVDVVLK